MGREVWSVRGHRFDSEAVGQGTWELGLGTWDSLEQALSPRSDTS